MADDAMFAPLAAPEVATGSNTSATMPKPVLSPIIPVPADALPCRWRHPKHGEPVDKWAYRLLNGELVSYAARVEYFAADGQQQKDVYPLTFCRVENGEGYYFAWRAHAVPAPRPLYLLPELAAAPGLPVIVTEGEKKADLVPRLFPGYLGTTSMGGAKAARLSNWGPLAGRNVTIWPDHDETGQRYAAEVAALATAAGAASVAIVEVPADWPEKWDLADLLPDGVGAEMLQGLLRSAVPWVPPAPQTGPWAADKTIPNSQASASPSIAFGDEAEIARLAALSAFDYEQERLQAAKQFRCRVSVLDKLVAEARGGVDDTLAGHALNLPEPEPWPEQVDGASLLDSIVAEISRHMVLDDGEADTLALWTVGTHVYDVFVIFPRLAITSPERRCGKTTLLDILASLVLRPLLASNISTAAVFRTVEAVHPTLLIDEFDRFLKNSEELIGVLNAGHRRGGQVIRVVETLDGGYEPRAFDCYAPAALAGIGKLPETLDDRSVKIKLRRKRRDEKVVSLRLDRMEAFEIISRKAARWADDNRMHLAAADPDMPPVLFNRVADNWRPLIAIADAVGGEWPKRARRVAEAAADQDRDESARTMLLADLRDLFDREPTGVLFTKEEILPALVVMDHRPWPEWRNEKPLSARQLAALLKPFRVSPGTVRRGNKTDKGYRRADLEDAFARYLDEAPAFQSVTPSQATDSAGFGDFLSVTRPENVTDPMAKKSRTPAGCDGVTDQDPLALEGEATWTA